MTSAPTADSSLTPTPVAKPRFENLDAMRAVSIFAVILYHYTARFPGSYTGMDALPFRFDYGWLGVDLFFIISGYCIFMTVAHAATLAEFWSKRVARIYPAYAVSAVVTFVVVALAGLPGREIDLATLVANLLGINLLTPAVRNVDGSLWSLIVEVKFYFWIGLIFFLLRRRNVVVAWTLFTLAGTAMACAGEGVGGQAGRLLALIANAVMIAPYAPAFLLGLLAYDWRSLSRPVGLSVLAIALALIAVGDRYTGIGLWAMLLALLGTLTTQWTSIRPPRALLWLGSISYPLYLIHQNVGIVVIREATLLPSLLRPLLAVVVVLLLSQALHWQVEFRFQRRFAMILERYLSSTPFAGSLLARDLT